MIKYVVEYKKGEYIVYRKLWWGGRKKVGHVRDGGIVSAKSVVIRDLLDDMVEYDFVNQNPGNEHHSRKNQRFL